MDSVKPLHAQPCAADEPATLQFWYEFASTYTYPCAMRIEAACRERNVALEWRPFLLGPIFRTQGLSDSPFNIYPAKGRYMWRDVERICEDLQLPFRRPRTFPKSGLLAARIAIALGNSERAHFSRSVFSASFADDADISDSKIMAALLAEAGLDAKSLLEAAATSAVKEGLRAQTESARERGVFGSPTLFVGSEMFWGNDRLESALEWAARHTRNATEGQKA